MNAEQNPACIALKKLACRNEKEKSVLLCSRIEARYANLNIKTNPHQVKPRGVLVARRGFEPRQTESKSVVLPLYYRAITGKQAAKIGNFKSFAN